MAVTPKLVLASASERRLALLRQAGLCPDLVQPAEIEEAPEKSELPAALAGRLAWAKAAAIAAGEREAFVLGADTVVAVGRRVLPKPRDEAEARHCLALLSGRGHRVLTGICVIAPNSPPRDRVVRSVVTFKRLGEAEIRWYLESGEWRGKAGGYAIQGLASRFVRKLTGSYTNVVGLPIFETVALIEGLGYPVRAPTRERVDDR